MTSLRRALIAAAIAACASPALPPGGPPDKIPPQVTGVTPDSGSVRTNPKEVLFQFNEVVAETPRGAPNLTGAILISPSAGDPDVGWHRSSISVRPRRGWRPNTTYVVTLLPGITDLRGNARDSATVLVFSTGDSIPQTRIGGTIFDWMKGTFAPRAYLEANPAGDTTVRFPAEADSLGRFALPYLAPGRYTLRALLDANRNRRVDANEMWDTATVELRDQLTRDFYAFPHDTAAGPNISSVIVVDSVTLRVTFDKPLKADTTYLPTIEIRTADSALVASTNISTWAALTRRRDARDRAVRDSIANADTNTARRAQREQARRDSINRAAAIADSLASDSTRRPVRPVSSRPPLVTEIGVELARPLPAGVPHQVRATAIGVTGLDKTSLRTFSRPRPAAADSGGRGRGGLR